MSWKTWHAPRQGRGMHRNRISELSIKRHGLSAKDRIFWIHVNRLLETKPGKYHIHHMKISE